MSAAEIDKMDEIFERWLGKQAITFNRSIIGSVIAMILTVAGATWKVSSSVNEIKIAIITNGHGDEKQGASLARLEARVEKLEARMTAAKL